MTIHFLCISWCLTGGNKGRGACSAMTRSPRSCGSGEARPSMLFAPLLPGGPLPRPPRQQHSNDRRNPPLPLDFLLPNGADPDTGVPSPSLCWPPGDDPKTTIAHQNTCTRSSTHTETQVDITSGTVRREKFSRLPYMLSRPHDPIVYLTAHAHEIELKEYKTFTNSLIFLQSRTTNIYQSWGGNTIRSNLMLVGNRCNSVGIYLCRIHNCLIARHPVTPEL